MNSADKRIEELLNRAGQTISDLPKANGIGMPYGVDTYKPLLKEASNFTQINAPAGFEVFNVIQYALHLTDVIDRLETALENQVTLHENLMHVIGNADIPDGASYEQFCLVVDNIYRAVQTAQEGWENYESGVPKDDD